MGICYIFNIYIGVFLNGITLNKPDFTDVEEPVPETKRCNTDPKRDGNNFNLTSASHNLPVTFANPRTSKMMAQPKLVSRTDTLIIKAKSFSGSETNKPPTILPLTSDQIQGILRSIKHPVKNKQDAATQSSPEALKGDWSRAEQVGGDMAVKNEHTPVTNIVNGSSNRKRCFIEVEVSGSGEKRIRLDLNTPPSTGSKPTQTLPEKETITPDVDILNTKKRGNPVIGKSSSSRALTFMSEAGELEQNASLGEPVISVCMTKPVATRAQPTIQHITVQMSNNQDGSGSSLYTIPVLNIPQTEAENPTKIILANGNLPVSASGVIDKSMLIANHMLQAVPASGYVTPSVHFSEKHSLMQNISANNSDTSDVPTQSLHILHHNSLSVSGLSSHPVNFVVPVTFSPPLTPHSKEPAVFTFSSISPSPSLSSSFQSQQTAFHLVHQSGPSSALKMLPVSSSTLSQAQTRAVLPSSQSTTFTPPKPFISCTNSAVMQARANNA